MGCCGCCFCPSVCKTKDRSIKDGIMKKRSCTDIVFLAAFIVSWAFLLQILLQADKDGADIDRVLNGVDLNGNICGFGSMKDKPLAMWPNPAYYDAMVCTDSCDETANESNNYMAIFHNSKKVINFCMPISIKTGVSWDSGTTSTTPSIEFQGNSLSIDTIARSINDVYTVWYVVVFAILFTTALTFCTAPVLRKFAGCMTFIMIMSIFVAMLIAALVMYQYSQKDGLTEATARSCEYGSYGIIGLTVLIALLFLAVRKKILMAVEVVKESGHAISDMFSILFFPILPIIIVLIYSCGWLFCSIYLASAGPIMTKSTPDLVKTNWSSGSSNSNPSTQTYYGDAPNYVYYQFYFLFHWFWTTQFMKYFGYLVFAGATADWYFTRTNNKGKKLRGDKPGHLTNSPIWESFKRSLAYHMGTVAVCALIIAIIKTIKAVVEYLEKKSRGNPPNKLQKAIFCCIKKFLDCLECCMDKINKSALVWVAIFGDSYATACCSSFSLLWRNLDKILAIHVVSHLILLCMELFIASAVTCVCTLWIMYAPAFEDKLESIFFPIFVIFVVSLGVAYCFMMVYKAVIDCIFFCFLVDNDRNGAGQMWASKSLQKLVNKYQAASKEQYKDLNNRRQDRNTTVEVMNTDEKKNRRGRK